MAGEWTTLPLEDCMAAIIDYRGKSPEKTTSGVPLVTAKIVKGGRIEKPEEFIAEADFDDWMRRGMPKPGDIVMTTEAPLGEVAQLDGRKVALAQRVITLRGKPDVLDNTFLKFLLQSTPVQEELRSRGTGTTVVGIRQSELRKISLTLPPLFEQRAIAAVLGALDDKIELNRRMNATLEAMARALFQSWFVDFDPVRAKQEGRPPAALDPATSALFPDSFQDSEVGRIPVGWTVRSLGNVIDLGSGVPYEAKFKGKSGLPMITLGCVSFHDRFQDKGLTYYSGSYKESHVVQTDNLVVASHDVTQERKQLGCPAMVPRWLKGSTILVATNLFVVRNNSKFPNQYLYQLFRSEGFRQQMVASAKGTAILFISKDSILRHRLAWPSEELAARFSTAAEALYSQYSINAAQTRTLATLRDTLLPKLLSGELRVPDAERAISAIL